MKKYKIELTDRQLTVYKDALEFYSRFMAGQLDHLPPIIDMNLNIPYEHKKRACDDLKKVLFPELPLNGSYGVGWSKKDKRQQEIQLAYEMYREVYVQREKDRQKKESKEIHIPLEKYYSVYQSETLHMSDQPIPKIEEVYNEKENKVSRFQYGSFLGPCYIYKGKCGHDVNEGNCFCPVCGIKLIWPDWSDV